MYTYMNKFILYHIYEYIIINMCFCSNYSVVRKNFQVVLQITLNHIFTWNPHTQWLVSKNTHCCGTQDKVCSLQEHSPGSRTTDNYSWFFGPYLLLNPLSCHFIFYFQAKSESLLRVKPVFKIQPGFHFPQNPIIKREPKRTSGRKKLKQPKSWWFRIIQILKQLWHGGCNENGNLIFLNQREVVKFLFFYVVDVHNRRKLPSRPYTRVSSIPTFLFSFHIVPLGKKWDPLVRDLRVKPCLNQHGFHFPQNPRP